MLTVGASPTMAERLGRREEWFFTPNATAQYFWQANRYIELGGGSSVYFWALVHPEGGPIFTPSLALRGIIPLDSTYKIGFTGSGGYLIGHYNDGWHDGLAITFGPNVDIFDKIHVFGELVATRLGLEATLFYAGEAPSPDRYQPVLALGASIGFRWGILWTEVDGSRSSQL